MHLRNVQDATPAESDHGETVYETVGHGPGRPPQPADRPGARSSVAALSVAEETYHFLEVAGRSEQCSPAATASPLRVRYTRS